MYEFPHKVLVTVGYQKLTQLKVFARYDGMSYIKLLKALASGYVSGDPDIRAFVEKYKLKEKLSYKKYIKISEASFQKQQEVNKLYNINQTSINKNVHDVEEISGIWIVTKPVNLLAKIAQLANVNFGLTTQDKLKLTFFIYYLLLYTVGGF